ncbi:macro domain-containing protein [Microbacteriaceae bacterium K1510]|nr:macro domain-containing protein [Microbacteriaceae bacterium K1510]
MESSAQTLVNTVNCVGVMGKGVAREFKERDPQMFASYKHICDKKLLAPGKLWLWRGADYWTLNFPTKIHWRNPSKLEWIEAGLQKFVDAHEGQGIREISFPRLGCGNGGLDWNDVRPLMERYLAQLKIEVYIHDYTKAIGLPEHLEDVAKTLEKEKLDETSFDSFLQSLHRAVDLVDHQFLDLSSHEPIKAEVGEDDLKIASQGETWDFDNEELRGVWVNLQKGVLTTEKAGWSSGGGRPLLSILSVLPQVRPIEIQRVDEAKPELALELRPRGNALVPVAKDQFDFAWR